MWLEIFPHGLQVNWRKIWANFRAFPPISSFCLFATELCKLVREMLTTDESNLKKKESIEVIATFLPRKLHWINHGQWWWQIHDTPKTRKERSIKRMQIISQSKERRILNYVKLGRLTTIIMAIFPRYSIYYLPLSLFWRRAYNYLTILRPSPGISL